MNSHHFGGPFTNRTQLHWHGCWEIFYMFACCGLVGNPDLAAKKVVFCSSSNVNQVIGALSSVAALTASEAGETLSQLEDHRVFWRSPFLGRSRRYLRSCCL